ncbi:stage II sporulation protein R [Seinonella peptonophila]|uniref:Stage II sporulation protein R n=1 Tax=Seinonella peptonophila TaxID=112248 RepID=A0A1M4XVD8_9BACL|nr:stage II sporulation protein R [Seinonella peptonophila]SHE97400.1 stage II sporulation protein R [Seinonella peptonophila]
MKRRIYIILTVICLLIATGYMIDPMSITENASLDQPAIPAQAIRLRILANSNTVQDQWLKRKVRDQIVSEMKQWAQQPKTRAEARQLIRKRLPQLQEIAIETIRRYGFSYPVHLQFGRVPFPTKLYGEQVYPAGFYEALLIRIGRGEGDNWWCVLFPPLCFVEMQNGDAVQAHSSASLVDNQAYAEEAKRVEQEQPPQVRFLLLDKYREWMQNLQK